MHNCPHGRNTLVEGDPRQVEDRKTQGCFRISGCRYADCSHESTPYGEPEQQSVLWAVFWRFDARIRGRRLTGQARRGDDQTGDRSSSMG